MTSEGRASKKRNEHRLRADGDVQKVKIRRVHGGCPGTGADEGRDYLRKALTSRRYALTQGCPNGETHPFTGTPQGEGTWGTETSQYLKEEKENSSPPVAASESGSAQTGRLASRGCRTSF